MKPIVQMVVAGFLGLVCIRMIGGTPVEGILGYWLMCVISLQLSPCKNHANNCNSCSSHEHRD